jgi:hypothetical protein
LGVAQIPNAMRDTSTTFLTYRKNVPRAEGLRGTGVRRDPLGEARDCTLRRYGGGTLSYLRAVVFEDLQIAN